MAGKVQFKAGYLEGSGMIFKVTISSYLRLWGYYI